MRGFLLGRLLAQDAERGTRTAALFYSLIESAKLCGVEPRAYLSETARRAIRSPGAVTLARDLKCAAPEGKQPIDRLRATVGRSRRTA